MSQIFKFKFSQVIFQSLEVADSGSETQLQVTEFFYLMVLSSEGFRGGSIIRKRRGGGGSDLKNKK